MKWQLTFSSAAILTCLLTLPSSLHADIAKRTIPEGDRQCAEILKPCFASSKHERTNCYFSAAKHPFCEGTELGKVTTKRWTMSPPSDAEPSAAQAFLGPKLVDGECIENFDTELFAAITKGDLSRETLRGLDKGLVRCNREPPSDLLRP